MGVTRVSQDGNAFFGSGGGTPGERQAAFRRKAAPGQVVEGLVTGVEDEAARIYRVRVEGLELTAATPFAVRRGTRLLLRVESLYPDIVLKFLRLAHGARGFDMGSYAQARARAEAGVEEAAREAAAMRAEFCARLGAPASWMHFSPRSLPGGALLSAHEGAVWAEERIMRAVGSCLVSGGERPPARLFLEGQIVPPQASYTLFADPEFAAFGDEAKAAAEAALVEGMCALVRPRLDTPRRVRLKCGLPAPGEVGPFLAARLG